MHNEALPMDQTDRQILALLQDDATMPVAEIARKVGLSATPCWRRIQKLEEAEIIRRRVALLDPEKINVGVTVFVLVRTNQHNLDWLEKFAEAVRDPRGGRVLPHERPGRLPAPGGGAGHRRLRRASTSG